MATNPSNGGPAGGRGSLTDGTNQGYPYIHVVSMDAQPTVSKGGSFSEIDGSFNLEVIPQSLSATLMVDLYIGCTWVASSGSKLYFQIYVESSSGSGIAAGAECVHSADFRRPVSVKGFIKVNATSGESFTFTPQWRTDGDTGYIATPSTDASGLIANFLVVTEVSDSTGLVVGKGANAIGNVSVL